MPERDFNEKRPDLQLEVGHGVAVDLRSLANASQKFASLIDEVGGDFAGVERPVKWIVEVEPGSVLLPLQAEAAIDDLRPGVAEQIGGVIADGLALLEREPVRPEYFTDKALDLAKELAMLGGDKLPIAVRNGRSPVRITNQLAANVEKVLGEPRETIGTIEGRLDALNVHGQSPHFSIWPAGDKRVKCSFGQRLDLDHDILPAVKKRVAAHGRIKTRPSGERLSVVVDELTVIGESPIPPDEVKGILRGYGEQAEW
ncbi:MAG TPA: hypothetical protein VHA80_09135 [Solirubrobacterales bacterium]|nr:hypothetical protein [Solirubrobacterales bacterium]